MHETPTARFLDISVQPTTMAELTDVVADGIATNQKWVIANHNLHSLYLYHKEVAEIPNGPFQRYFNRAHRTHIDGMSIVALARLYGRDVHRTHRIGYIDWLPTLMGSAAEKKWRVFYLGSAPGVTDRGVAILRERHKGLEIKGQHGYFDTNPESVENQEILRQIAEFQPHLLLVGMGMPRQELWVEANFDAIQANVTLVSGAALDYVAGVIPTPPRWSGQLGVEWAFRLAAEPKRLASRYLIEPWTVLRVVARDMLSTAIGAETAFPLEAESELD